jgi:hypothetical protein
MQDSGAKTWPSKIKKSNPKGWYKQCQHKSGNNPKRVISKTQNTHYHGQPWESAYGCETELQKKARSDRLEHRNRWMNQLETRLKQMWVLREVIQIVDLSHDFYLVTFTSFEDQCRALTEGPWLIYDHYLAVRPWCPNFNPSNATITKTAVWVCFTGLPIEYNDSRILHFMKI